MAHWTAALDPVRMARCYGLRHVIDYGPQRAGRGLLVTTGAGLLLADMDVLPTCRWAADLGADRGHPYAADWASVCARLVSHTVAHLWLALTDPAWMASVLMSFPPGLLAVCARPAIRVGHQATDVEELAAWCETAGWQ
ncbi:hypothetical protein ADL21_11220 [Streptomyces albus subsp. albus]|nr:hypothetical protein ADL21_11220 [Streptomyces albus subsp. albus]